ncbi:uncharacterized protein LOC127242583 [Andrographis paniculata]|uniref:uncharacterized protein LOC127242583 n=1 Tax=Andrographis paniculata TaxID=175694 RepID=UPI0021E8EB67|nr:uncharacterized protein LOC127242583 [Andrographis paniculata]
MAMIQAIDEEVCLETRVALPAHFVMKISKHCILNCESQVFTAGGYNWKLKIYPDGLDGCHNSDYLSVLLSMVETSTSSADFEVNVMCSILLYNQNSDYYVY